MLAALRSDSELGNLVAPANVLVNYAKEGRPSNLAPSSFIILRWEEVNINPGVDSVTRTLTVWAHHPAEKSTDYAILDDILNSVKNVLTGMEHVAGLDGYTVTCIEYQGDSADLKDDAFNTISRNSTYKVLSRASA